MSDQKKNCVVVTWFYPDQPGYLDFSYRVRALARHYRLTVLSRARLTQPELLIDGVEYVVLPTPGVKTKDLIGYQFAVRHYLKLCNPDLAVLLGSQTAAMASWLRGVPIAVYWNEHPTHFLMPPADVGWPKKVVGAWLRALTYAGASRARCVMPIGEAHRDDLLSHGVRPERTRLLYMGVDKMFAGLADQTSPPVGPSDPLRVIYTGSVLKERGRDVMLEAVALANRAAPRVALTLVGAQPEQIKYCRARAAELGIVDAVRVVGRVPGDEVPKYLAQADAGICIWEDRVYWRFNPPTKLFEYLVAGLPVLASNIRTHTQYIQHGHNGLIFDYAPEALAGALSLLWERRADLPLFRRNAVESSRRYLWDSIEPEFLTALDAIARAE